jgi:hypothetical protein
MILLFLSAITNGHKREFLIFETHSVIVVSCRATEAIDYGVKPTRRMRSWKRGSELCHRRRLALRCFTQLGLELFSAMDTNTFYDNFLRDTVLNTTIRVSVHASGAGEANSHSTIPAISNDGLVYFLSIASNLVGNDTNSTQDAFLYGSSYAVAHSAISEWATGTWSTTGSLNAARTS